MKIRIELENVYDIRLCNIMTKIVGKRHEENEEIDEKLKGYICEMSFSEIFVEKFVEIIEHYEDMLMKFADDISEHLKAIRESGKFRELLFMGADLMGLVTILRGEIKCDETKIADEKVA